MSAPAAGKKQQAPQQLLHKMKNKEVKVISCEEAVARFNDFMDNYIKGKAREELLGHISDCQQCMERFEFEQLLKAKVQQLPKSELDQSLISRIEQMIASL
jgi:hypothetical protein